MRAALAAALLLSACGRGPSYEAYGDPAAGFSTELPKGLKADLAGPFPEWPAKRTQWVLEAADEHEGAVLGAIITIWRMERKAGEKQARYRDEMLAATEALFSDEQPPDVLVAPGEFAGRPARAFQRELVENLGGGLHGTPRAHPSRISGVAVETPDAYYVLEYRATLELFDKHLPVFQRVRERFKLTPE